MDIRRLGPQDLAGKIIDIHSHAGVSLKPYMRTEFPYCQSVEDLYYRQIAGGVDVNVVFPFSEDLYFDPEQVKEGYAVPARAPISDVPFGLENKMLFTEVYSFCREHWQRFLPFVCIDPERDVEGQLRTLTDLDAQYPLYGLKAVPVSSQARLDGLLGPCEAIMDFAVARDLPFLFHVTTYPGDQWSQVSYAFRIAERYPDSRICLAHCIGFDRASLERADAMENIWVDTAALKIQVDLAHERNAVMPADEALFEADYSSHVKVMNALMEQFPNTIIWGTDSPAYSYICGRRESTGKFQEFRLKGFYEQEVEALDGLCPDLREKAGTTNSLAFLFGRP